MTTRPPSLRLSTICIGVQMDSQWGQRTKKQGKVQKVKVTVCVVAFSAQPPNCNSYNFCIYFLNQLQQVLLESLESLFLDGSI